MTNITFSDRHGSYGIRSVELGDLFRFANGNRTSDVFMALAKRNEGYNTIMTARNMANGDLCELYTNTRKERVIIYVSIDSMVVRDIDCVDSRKEPIRETIESDELPTGEDK